MGLTVDVELDVALDDRAELVGVVHVVGPDLAWRIDTEPTRSRSFQLRSMAARSTVIAIRCTAAAPERATVGLRETRTKEWLLDIEYRKRETFAYSCEAYGRVLERGKNPTERRAHAEEYGSAVHISEERVDAAEVAGIVAEAAAARNGWKIILSRCAPTSRPRTALQQLRDSQAAQDTARRR